MPKKIEGKKFDNDKPNLLPLLEQVKKLYTIEDFYKGKKTNDIKVKDEDLDYNITPKLALKEVVKVLIYGKIKYGLDNWRYVLNKKFRYSKALLRHFVLWFFWNEKIDQESGFHHLAHCMCSLLFLLEIDLEKIKKV